MRARLRLAADAVLSVLLAPSCAACGRLLEEPTRGPVCVPCWRAVPFITPPVCDVCGDPLAGWRTAAVERERCARCRRAPRAIDRGRAVGVYDGSLRAIVHALKYDGRRSLARPLATLMCRQSAGLLEGATCAVPVPLHARRRRERGFNQAADLARHLGLPVAHALRRCRATPTQTSLPAAQRHRNVRDAFVLTALGRQLARATIVLVDDVSTTGATLDACARALKEGGVAEVRALTVARAVSLAIP